MDKIRILKEVLPTDLANIIFEFDDPYKKRFKYVLYDIKHGNKFLCLNCLEIKTNFFNYKFNCGLPFCSDCSKTHNINCIKCLEHDYKKKYNGFKMFKNF